MSEAALQPAVRPRKTFRDITYEVFDRAQALFDIAALRAKGGK